MFKNTDDIALFLLFIRINVNAAIQTLVPKVFTELWYSLKYEQNKEQRRLKEAKKQDMNSLKHKTESIYIYSLTIADAFMLFTTYKWW